MPYSVTPDVMSARAAHRAGRVRSEAREDILRGGGRHARGRQGAAYLPSAVCPHVRRTLALVILLALLLALLPSAAAAVAFVLEYDDPRGDVWAASADVVRVASDVADGVVTQRVEMAAAPNLTHDTLILRSWFHNSTNGSFHVVDLEIHAGREEDQKFRALVRRGAFENTSALSATWSVEGNAWVFAFPEAAVADATCFDPIVWAQHEPENGSWTTDQAGIGTRYCRVRGDPSPAPTGPPPIITRDPGAPRETGGVPVPPSVTSRAQRPPDPPGTYSPALSLPVVMGVIALTAILTSRTWRRR